MMTLSDYVARFITDISVTRWQEWVSTIAQVLSVWYARQNNIWVYPTGILGVLLAAWVYFFIASPPLYADACLNIYYFLMSVYGWYNWTRRDASDLMYPISWCNRNELFSGIYWFCASWAVIFIALKGYTDSNTPLLDSLVSSTAITAMWWMAKRKVENWLAWIVSNIVAIPLNFYKGFMLFTLMYVVFLGLAWLGYQSWRKQVNFLK
ncbi:MAG: nicotinamide mononucleotide transporter [Saprospiraceae bacterium]|nr:nicotinamide mononucleotide transporter [Saprospiraceae bacterium]